jgi:DNA-binding GntR family transcriptional regulator
MREFLDDNPLVVPTIQESVADRLRNLILSRHLRPGERLVQSELAEQLGVSRTPIREALYELASDGLVVLSPYKGASVADFSLEDLEGIYSIRIPLEGYGAYLATQSIGPEDLIQLQALVDRMEQSFQRGDRWQLLEVNREFYATFYAIAGRQRLYDLIMKHLDMAGLYRRMAFTVENHYAGTVTEHAELLDLVKQGDAVEVERRTRAGLEETVATLVSLWKETEMSW